MNKLFLILLVLLFAGCAQPVVQMVEVPVKCKVEKPPRPSKSDDYFETLKSLMVYLRELEVIVSHCVEDSD